MIVNLWSTPRTGSNWYSYFLCKKYNVKQLYPQYLNRYHFYNYEKEDYNDFVYEYDIDCFYKYYYLDILKKSIEFKYKKEKRSLDIVEEENYRLELLDKLDHKKNPSIFYSHVQPMSEISYYKLFDMADKNIFLYRKDIKRQISSYALAYGTSQYKATTKPIVYENIHTDLEVLQNLVDRIIYWHKLDKTNCEIVCYEDLDFSIKDQMPRKQNNVDPFLQLDQTTQESVISLVEYFRKNV